MKTFKHAFTALAFACMAAGASAKTIDVAMDIVVTSKADRQLVLGRDTYVDDGTFSPTSFSMTWHIDLDKFINQNLIQGPDVAPWATTTFDTNVTSGETPFTSALHAAAPSGSLDNPVSGAFLRKAGSLIGSDPATPQPVTDQFATMNTDFWTLQSGGGSGTLTETGYQRTVNIQRNRESTIALLTGDDVIAFLESQVGLTQEDAFVEEGGQIVSKLDDAVPAGLLSTSGTKYRGDVIIRSVTPAVPEPGAWLLGLAGMGLVTWRAAHRGQAGASRTA